MKKYLIPCLLIGFFLCGEAVNAQVGIYMGPGGYYGPRYGRPYRYRDEDRYRERNRPPFKPVVHLSFGYGFPNLDKQELPDFFHYYKGSYSQTGPITGAVDVQFSRNMSIGLMVTHGKVSVPYYSYNTSDESFKGSLDNWSVMLDMVRYMPVSATFSPYLRTAFGINSWKQDYTDVGGNKVNTGVVPSDFAYQVALGAKLSVTRNTGVFLEAGYGKYILHGGLAFKL
jgi:hypothetical protein